MDNVPLADTGAQQSRKGQIGWRDGLARLGPALFTRVAARRAFNRGRSAFYQRVLGVRYRERNVHDYRLILDLHDEGISEQLMVRGDREQEHAFVLRRVVSRGMTVLDVGANIGYYTVMLARLVGPEGRVFAVEPSASNYHLLSLNVRLNGLESWVEPHLLGIGRDSGVEKMYPSAFSNCHTFCPAVYGSSDEPPSAGTPVEVPVTSVRDFVSTRGTVDLMRMDIEGYEVEVIDGFVRDLSEIENRPALLFETHPERYHESEHDMRGVLQALFDQGGYRVRYLASDGQHDYGAGAALLERGYADDHIVASFPICDRAVYEGVSSEDAIELICGTAFVRAVLLEAE